MSELNKDKEESKWHYQKQPDENTPQQTEPSSQATTHQRAIQRLPTTSAISIGKRTRVNAPPENINDPVQEEDALIVNGDSSQSPEAPSDAPPTPSARNAPPDVPPIPPLSARTPRSPPPPLPSDPPPSARGNPSDPPTSARGPPPDAPPPLPPSDAPPPVQSNTSSETTNSSPPSDIPPPPAYKPKSVKRRSSKKDPAKNLKRTPTDSDKLSSSPPKEGVTFSPDVPTESLIYDESKMISDLNKRKKMKRGSEKSKSRSGTPKKSDKKTGESSDASGEKTEGTDYSESEKSEGSKISKSKSRLANRIPDFDTAASEMSEANEASEIQSEDKSEADKKMKRISFLNKSDISIDEIVSSITTADLSSEGSVIADSVRDSSIVLKTPDSLSQLVYFDNEIETINDLFKLLAAHSPQSFRFMHDVVQPTHYSVVSSSLVHISFKSNSTLSLIESLLETEFKMMNDGREFFAESSVLNDFMRPYFLIVGKTFIQTLFDKVLQQLVSEKHATYDILSKDLSSTERERNKQALYDRVRSIVESLTSHKTVDQIPLGIRALCKYISTLCTKYKCEPKQNKILAKFIIRRFIIPPLTPSILEDYLALPKGKPLSDLTKKKLSIIVDVLKALSGDDVQTSLDTRMLQRGLDDWYNTLISVTLNLQSVHESINTTVGNYNYYIFHDLAYTLKARIENSFPLSSKEDCVKALEKLGSFQNKQRLLSLDGPHRKFVMDVLNNRGDKLFYVGYLKVKVTKKKEKEKNEILVIGMYRIILLSVKGKVKIDMHQTMLRKIRNNTPTHLEINFDDPEKMIIGETDDVDRIILCIHRSFQDNFPGMEAKFLAELPAERRNSLQNYKSQVPCDGIANSYKSLSNLYNQPPLESLVWDLTHMYKTSTKFDLRTYTDEALPPITDSQVLPLLHAIKYNRQFTTLIINNFYFRESSTFRGLVEIAKQNCTLTKLTLSYVSIGKVNGPSFADFFDALRDNAKLVLNDLDISYTPLDENATKAIAAYMGSRSFQSLNLSGCFSKNGTETVLSSLLMNSSTNRNLISFKWNTAKLELYTLKLCQFLARCTDLKHLELSDTGITIPTLIQQALMNTKKLEHLDVSYNKFSKDQQWQGLTSYLSNNTNYSSKLTLNISSTSIPITVLTSVLLIKEGNIDVIATDNNLYVSSSLTTTTTLTG
eukprot:TRINITY_DN6871_c0_g1_i2.p1 TRINITY_DN6871_c0_g1~~TRINITY_DN6871_c0_g1_i2.p1  ORF type:complete len:1175 (+),score=348.58 TRINITY_DN6871_c0_g1_i2:20-3544(+)